MPDANLSHVSAGQPIGTQPINALVDAARRPLAGIGIADTAVGRAVVRRGVGGVGDSYTVCKVTAVHADRFECKNIILETGELTGDAFDVWPIVYEGGITVDYDLTIEEGDGMVFPRLRANARVRVETVAKRISLEDGVAAELRVYCPDPFYVACVPA